MRLLLSNNKHVGTKIGWKHGTNSNQLYRPEASLTGGKASPADTTCQGLHRHGSTRVPDGYPNSRLSHCQALKQQYQLIRPFEQDSVAEDLDLGYEIDRDAAVWRTTGTPLDDFEFGDNLEAVAQDAVRSGADLLESLDGLTLDEEAYKWFISSCVTGDLHDATRCLTSSTPSGAYEEILTGTLP
jgi:hypothetical protein